MNGKTKIGIEILGASLILGVLGDFLLRQSPSGISILLFILALSAALWLLSKRWNPETISKDSLMLHIALIFFAGCFAWRSSIQLMVLDTLAIFSILAILSLSSLKIKAHLAGISHYVLGGMWSFINMAVSPIFVLTADIKWGSIPNTGFTKHLIAVFKGMAIVAPILFIFTALFMAADAVFEGIIENTFMLEPGELFGRLIFVGFFSWIVAGYLRGNLIPDLTPGIVNASKEVSISPLESGGESSDAGLKPQPASVTEPDDPPAKEKNEKAEWPRSINWRELDNSILPEWATLGRIEISIILGLINLLFLSFVIIQIPYLFGGFDFVQQAGDLKLADYARRGFGELVAVAAMVMPILLGSHWLLRKGDTKNEMIFRILAGIQIGLLFIIMASAAQRLFVLTGNLGYGLTVVRFYPMIFMIWLGLIFIWFTMTVLRGARNQFAWGAFWSGLFILAGLHFLNPDDFIARTNIRLMKEGRDFDGAYHQTLSSDAVPALIEGMPFMSVRNKCAINSKIIWGLSQGSIDFRSWNYSREAAYEKMNEFGITIDPALCRAAQPVPVYPAESRDAAPPPGED